MKVAIIGGGSYQWSLGFCRQFIMSERLRDVELSLMDVDESALDLVAECAETVRRKAKAPLRILKTTDTAAALDGADFVIVSISTGGLDAMEHDLAIPEKYGIRHTVGDTVGPAGWARAARNIPVFHGIAEQMKKRCPEAWLINVSNPLTPLTRTPSRCFGIRTIGMCPGVENQVRRLVSLAGFPECRNVDYVVTGIDHGSWFTKIVADGRDVLARLKELGYWRSDGTLPTDVVTADPLAEPAYTRAAFAVWREIGYLPSITDRHIVENFPWFLTQPTAELPFRLKRTPVAERRQWRAGWKETLDRFVRSGDESVLGRSHGDDPVVSVIEALSGGPALLYGANYMNIGQTPGFPDGAVLETRCRFDGAGVHPLCSPMPEILKALVLPTVIRQETIIAIALAGTFDEFVALMYTDPLCSRLLPGQCRQMARELLEANRAWIRNPRLLAF